MAHNSHLEIISHFEGRLIELKMNFNEKNTYAVAGLTTILETLKSIQKSPNLRTVLLISAHDKYFSNGLEPTMFLGAKREDIYHAVSLLMEASKAYYFFPFPTISLIQGHCMAAGAVFAIFSDYRFMIDKGARIGFSEALIALNFPSFPAKILAMLVGYQNARDLLYSGKLLKGEDAKAMKLVDFAYPSERIHEEAMKFAKKLSDLPLASAVGLKKSLIDAQRNGIEQLIDWDIEALVDTIMTADAQEGFLSILESRKPKFNS